MQILPDAFAKRKGVWIGLLAAAPFGFSVAAYGKIAPGFPLMLRQRRGLDELSRRWPSPHAFGPMKPVQTPSRYSVRAAIAASLCDGGAALERTATQLGMSPRSLQRHLAAMGTSYRDMVAEVRLDTACRLLLESNESISEIAQRLGYAGTSSFSRVFMRWKKIQPVMYRRQSAVQGNDESRIGTEPHVSISPPSLRQRK